MKKLMLPLFAMLCLIACEKENTADLVQEEVTYEDGSATDRNPNKRDVCHKGKIKNISVNALPAHQGHGDAVDMDGDGYFDMENDCGMPVDCDDSVYDPDNSCCEGYEIDSNGPLFVAPADEFIDEPIGWQTAVAKCAAKAEADGCDWKLPSKNELNALYGEKNNIGGFSNTDYWSSTEGDDSDVWVQNFGNGDPRLESPDYDLTFTINCRCVRR